MSSFSDMPPPVKIGLPLGAGGILGASALTLTGGTMPWYVVLLFALVILVVVVGALWGILWLHDKVKAGKLLGGLLDSARTGGEEVGESKAQLEHQRTQFRNGLTLYKQQAGDMRKKPWFLIMGHPGSGKTYAVAQSEIEWVSGLNKVIPGTGGTRSMDWWFARDAIILDTAGRYVEGARQGDRADEQRRRAAAREQLESFLGRLRENRSHCPINGLILAIAVTDLLLEDQAERASRAKDLKATLDRVQAVLDVRFPVIVWVTKCDKIAGFRQYCRNFARDAAARYQMVGWSNPSNDFNASQFNAAEVSAALDKLGHDFREHRWNLLAQLAPQGETFADAAGALYCFPEAWEKTVPPLKEYLTTLFAHGGEKPPYFRGVYFNSAVTEGEELDEQLAVLTARNLRSIWQRENEAKANNEPLYSETITYFIRDTLTEKLFKEQGLVSRYSNAVTMLRRNRLKVLEAAAVVLLLMVGWAWWSQRQLRQEILSQSGRWVNLQARLAAPRGGAAPGEETVNESALRVMRGSDKTAWTYAGQGEIGLLPNPDAAPSESVSREPLLRFYDGLLHQATTDIHPGPLFRILRPGRKTDKELRQRLWTGAFHKYGLEPLLEAAASGLGASWHTNASPAVLEALLRWEAAVGTLGQAAGSPPLAEGTNSLFALPLLQSVTLLGVQANADFDPQRLPDDARVLDKLCASLLRLTGTNAPALARASSNAAQRGVSNALARLEEHANEALRSATNDSKSLLALRKLYDALDQLEDSQARLGTAIINWSNKPGFSNEVDQVNAQRMAEAMAAYHSSYQASYAAWKSAATATQPAARTALEALHHWQTNAQLHALRGIQVLEDRLALVTFTNRELGTRVIARSAELRAGTSNRLSAVAGLLLPRLEKGDANELSAIEGGASSMTRRHSLYTQAVKLFEVSEGPELRSDVVAALERSQAQAADLLRSLNDFATRTNAVRFDEAFSNALSRLVHLTLCYQTNRLGRLLEAESLVQAPARYPFQRDDRWGDPFSAAEVRELRDRLARQRAALVALERPTTSVDAALSVAELLLDTNGDARKMSISVRPPSSLPPEARGLLGTNRYGDSYRVLRLNEGKEEIDILSESHTWPVNLAAPSLRFEIKLKTAAGRFSEVPLGVGPGAWAPLRWIERVVQDKAYAVPEGTNGFTLLVRLEAPAGQECFPVLVTLDGAPADWKQRLEIK